MEVWLKVEIERWESIRCDIKIVGGLVGLGRG